MKKFNINNVFSYKVLFVLLTLFFVVLIFYFNSFIGTVDGERITKSEYLFFLNSVKLEMEELAKVADDPNAKKIFWETKIAGKNAKVEARQMALERLRELKIELIKAKENGIVLSEDERKEIKSALKERIKEYGGEKKAEEVIYDKYQITIDEYEDIFGSLRIVYNFIKQEQSKIKISEQEIKKYYFQNRDKIDTVKVISILLNSTNNSNNEATSIDNEKQKDPKTLADSILERARKGEDIRELAKIYSQDPEKNSNKNEYVVEYSGKNSNYAEPFKNWVLSHYPSDTDIIKTIYGYHVVMITKRTNFEEVKSVALENSRGEKFGQVMDAWKKMPQYNYESNVILSIIEKILGKTQ